MQILHNILVHPTQSFTLVQVTFAYNQSYYYTSKNSFNYRITVLDLSTQQLSGLRTIGPIIPKWLVLVAKHTKHFPKRLTIQIYSPGIEYWIDDEIQY